MWGPRHVQTFTRRTRKGVPSESPWARLPLISIRALRRTVSVLARNAFCTHRTRCESRLSRPGSKKCRWPVVCFVSSQPYCCDANSSNRQAPSLPIHGCHRGGLTRPQGGAYRATCPRSSRDLARMLQLATAAAPLDPMWAIVLM